MSELHDRAVKLIREDRVPESALVDLLTEFDDFDHEQELLVALRSRREPALDVEHWTQLGGGCSAVAIILRRGGSPVKFNNVPTGETHATRYLMVTWDAEWVVCLYDDSTEIAELHDGLRLDTRGIGQYQMGALAHSIAAFAAAFA